MRSISWMHSDFWNRILNTYIVLIKKVYVFLFEWASMFIWVSFFIKTLK